MLVYIMIMFFFSYVSDGPRARLVIPHPRRGKRPRGLAARETFSSTAKIKKEYIFVLTYKSVFATIQSGGAI